MSKYYLDAGTTYSKIIEIVDEGDSESVFHQYCFDSLNGKTYYILPSKELKKFDIKFERTCGHMSFQGEAPHENEIIMLSKGAQKYISKDATILDLGSCDAKWVRFKDSKFKDMDWNTSCASSTGATVEMLLKFYDVDTKELKFTQEKFPVTCGVFGLERIMDDITKGEETTSAISKFIHGIAYNAWMFAKKPEKIYLSGGFCDNECFVDSLKKYCEVECLGRFILCEGLIDSK